MLHWCMGSLQTLTCSQGTCQVGPTPLWRSSTGASFFMVCPSLNTYSKAPLSPPPQDSAGVHWQEWETSIHVVSAAGQHLQVSCVILKAFFSFSPVHLVLITYKFMPTICPVSFQRENKNRYLFAYFKSLVDCGIFEHIYLNFLPVGHTHCDIDQLFSRVATFLKGMFRIAFYCTYFQTCRPLPFL